MKKSKMLKAIKALLVEYESIRDKERVGYRFELGLGDKCPLCEATKIDSLSKVSCPDCAWLLIEETGCRGYYLVPIKDRIKRLKRWLKKRKVLSRNI